MIEEVIVKHDWRSVPMFYLILRWGNHQYHCFNFGNFDHALVVSLQNSEVPNFRNSISYIVQPYSWHKYLDFEHLEKNITKRAIKRPGSDFRTHQAQSTDTHTFPKHMKVQLAVGAANSLDVFFVFFLYFFKSVSACACGWRSFPVTSMFFTCWRRWWSVPCALLWAWWMTGSNRADKHRCPTTQLTSALTVTELASNRLWQGSVSTHLRHTHTKTSLKWAQNVHMHTAYIT